MAQIEAQDSGDGKKIRSKKQSTKVDMAPLVDLGFLLITFFMFAATSIKPNVMNLNMPPKIDLPQNVDRPEIKLSNSLTIMIGKDNKLFWHQTDEKGLTVETLNETDYSAEGVRKVITTATQKAEDKDMFTVIIKPTEEASYKNLVDVLDEMAITKSNKYGIVEVKPFEQKVFDEKMGK